MIPKIKDGDKIAALYYDVLICPPVKLPIVDFFVIKLQCKTKNRSYQKKDLKTKAMQFYIQQSFQSVTFKIFWETRWLFYNIYNYL